MLPFRWIASSAAPPRNDEILTITALYLFYPFYRLYLFYLSKPPRNKLLQLRNVLFLLCRNKN